jgi:hypothetical protein
MEYKESTYKGDHEYCIGCHNDIVVSDYIAFNKACFSGSYRKPKFSHFELIKGVVIKESYGGEKQQHTFTIQQENGEKLLIKGRNLYKNGVWRKAWEDENLRIPVALEKHERGSRARKMKKARLDIKIPGVCVGHGNKLQAILLSLDLEGVKK